MHGCQDQGCKTSTHGLSGMDLLAEPARQQHRTGDRRKKVVPGAHAVVLMDEAGWHIAGLQIAGGSAKDIPIISHDVFLLAGRRRLVLVPRKPGSDLRRGSSDRGADWGR